MPMKREDKRKLKLCVLNQIKLKKEVLFGAFSDKLTKQDKSKAWQDVYDYGLAISAVPAGKDGTYIRDVWWPNARKSTMEKFDNAKKTGTGGVPGGQFTDVDDTIYDIIGRDSPVIKGLPVTESSEINAGSSEASDKDRFIDVMSGMNMEMDFLHDDNVDIITINESYTNGSKKQNRKRTVISKSQEALPNESVPHDKAKLQLDLLKLQIYKTQLETRKLELELGLPRSEFTKDVAIDIYDVEEGGSFG